MLTMVQPKTQPWFPLSLLTSVEMKPDDTTLEQRIAKAMELSGASPARLAKVCGISAAAVTKWTRGRTSNLKNEHLFKVADACQVDPRWLGTGAGRPRPVGAVRDMPRPDLANGLPEIALRVARKWNALDDPGKTQILMLIETLGALQNENYRQWGIEQQRAAKSRRAKEPQGST